MGWVMLFVGLLLPVAIGPFVVGRRHADLLLTGLALVSLPMLVWGASLGAEIGPCKVGPCQSSAQHSHFEIAIAALALVLLAIGLLAVHRKFSGGGVLVVGLLVGAYSMLKTDFACFVTLVMLALGAGAYLIVEYGLEHPRTQVPDYPPVA